jgi:Chaperone of endosialidase
MKNRNTTLTTILLALGCLALLTTALAVSPTPDGGYPGGNTAEGQNALFSLTSGTYNTAVGLFSLRNNTTGNLNTAIGAGTLLLNTGDENTATGAAALLSNTTGVSNTAAGAFALFSNTTGNSNTANGVFALLHNTTGSFNTAIGADALDLNIIGSYNTATGFDSLVNNTIGTYNAANGYQALYNNTEGRENTATGRQALFFNTTGIDNTAEGYGALFNNVTGSNNTALGFGAGSNVTTANNVICFGALGANVDNSCYIGNIAGQTVGAGGTTCYVDNDGKLGVILSARRFKTDIADMGTASEGLLALRPVTFHYKPELDKTGIPQFGLVAEEVAKVNPNLVTHDGKGELNTVRYEAVNAMLLNEFLKEHKTVEELRSTAAKQEEQILALTSGLERVTAQLEATKAVSQIASGNP